MQRALVVSIHDVAPATQPQVARIIAELAAHRVTNCSLLVVPDYHRRGNSLGDPGFCAWLHQLEEQGHEIVIHGFFHERVPRRDESIREKLVTRFYTANEGEFFDLNYDAALELIRKAREDFAAHGFHPCGFIAPAWLLSGEAERAAVDAGMSYTTTLRAVRDFIAGEEFKSQSLVYSTRSRWRRGLSLLWNRWLFSCLTTNELLRLSLHPPDFSHQMIWRQITALVQRATRERAPLTYRDWLKRASAIRAPHSALA